MESSNWVGIDVSKTHLDICAGGEHVRFGVNDELDAAIAWVVKAQPKGVVLEATGGYEQRIALELQKRQYDVAVVNPRCVRDFAKSRGRLAKTDKLDARILAEFGTVNTPRITHVASELETRLRQIISRRDQVADLRQVAKQHREHISDAGMLKRAQKIVDSLEREVRALDKLAASLVRQDERLRTRWELLQTVPGIGPVIAVGLLVHMPELGKLTKAEAAALAGLAPMNCDSGAMRGQRHIQGGRFRARKLLFIAAVVNQRCKMSPFKDRHEALRERGKAPKVARIAAARSILVAINAILKAGTPFSAERAQMKKAA